MMVVTGRKGMLLLLWYPLGLLKRVIASKPRWYLGGDSLPRSVPSFFLQCGSKEIQIPSWPSQADTLVLTTYLSINLTIFFFHLDWSYQNRNAHKSPHHNFCLFRGQETQNKES
ncbi:hypothetical protein CPB84DRAFT_1792074 [Gymnopilus junonius]|uniref:Secreted protein n=1 Tax=Gymnopilus junonius TaxID=109634 RepID=A0A9P5TIA2_GYMJU|nr:hypothetical protein CPB84DRAFT_1792074 [Gymnopilus junonius]